jgi:ATP citrate (pro-S)-lyase
VAWAIGTCAKMFTTEVQFGHAGSMANSDMEIADAKNRAMREAGFVVPDTFDSEELPHVLKETYEKPVRSGTNAILLNCFTNCSYGNVTVTYLPK